MHQTQSVLTKLTEKRPHFARFIREVIQQDPRPAYQQGKIDDKIYGMALYEFNITWKISTQSANLAQVLAIEPLKGNNRLNNIK